MSDDLLRRANDVPHGLFCPGRFPDSVDRCTCPRKVALDLAARVRELEAELAEWSKWGIVEIAARNPSVMEYIKHWEGRTERAESRVDNLERSLRELNAELTLSRAAYREQRDSPNRPNRDDAYEASLCAAAVRALAGEKP